MDFFKLTERFMSMDDKTWKRHANPLSVWSRFTCLPLLALAVFSRAWIGWLALGPVAVAVVWIWLNPRLFGPPTSLDSWASKGTLGERRFLNRKSNPVPRHHERAALILTTLSATGAMVLIYGLVVLDGWASVCGVVLTALPKVWFVDRMVWLHDDMSLAEQKEDSASH